MKKRVLHLDPVTDQPPEESPEQALYRGVLLQTALDATTTVKEGETKHAASVRDSARAFVYAVSDATAEWFEEICSRAGVAPSYFRGFIRSFVENSKRFMLREPLQ